MSSPENMFQAKGTLGVSSLGRQTDPSIKLPFEHYKALVWYLRILGLIPLSRDSITGQLRFRLFSFATLYTLFTIIATSALSAFIFKKQLTIILHNTLTFDELFTHYSILFFHGVFFLPICAYVELRHMCKLALLWGDFRAHYIRTTGHQLVISLRREQYLMAVVFLMGTVSFFTVDTIALLSRFENYTDDSSYFVAILSIVYGIYASLCLALCGVWFTVTVSITKAAAILLHQLKEFPRDGVTLQDIHSLWLKLRSITEETGTSFSLSISYYLMFIFIIVMGVCYMAFTLPVGKGVSIAMVLSSLAMFNIMGECAHRAVQAVGDDFLKTLFDKMASQQMIAVRNDLERFAQSIAIHEPCIALSGFVKLDRTFNVSMLGTLVTYMVIVIQFRNNPTSIPPALEH